MFALSADTAAADTAAANKAGATNTLVAVISVAADIPASVDEHIRNW